MSQNSHGEGFIGTFLHNLYKCSSLRKQNAALHLNLTNKQGKEFCVQRKTDGRRSGRGVNLASVPLSKWDSGDLWDKKGSFRDVTARILVQYQ